MKSEIIEIVHEKLVGEWRHQEASKRLIVICHGYMGSSEDPTLVAIRDGLNHNGSINRG